MEVLNICILYITVNTFFFFSSSSIISSRFSSAIILSSFFRTSKRTLLSTFSPETSHILISASSTYTLSNSKGSFYTGQNKKKQSKKKKPKNSKNINHESIMLRKPHIHNYMACDYKPSNLNPPSCK